MSFNWKKVRMVSFHIVFHSIVTAFSLSVMFSAAEIYGSPPELMAGVLAGMIYMVIYGTLAGAFDHII